LTTSVIDGVAAGRLIAAIDSRWSVGHNALPGRRDPCQDAAVDYAVNQVVVFDTSLDARELRLHRTERLIERGVVPGSPRLFDTGDRLECLDILGGVRIPGNEPPISLLLCDMVDERVGEVGNIGARLLRTVACDEGLAARVVRVLWTRYDHPTVISDIASYAQAYVWFDHADRDSAGLTAAIRAVFADGRPDGFRHFAPRGMTIESFDAQWRQTIRSLLEDPQRLKLNDDIAAASILREEPDKMTDVVLKKARDAVSERERRRYCENVDEFLDRVKGDKKEARQLVRGALINVSQEGIATQIKPVMVERAHALMQRFSRPLMLRYLTLLTEAEDEVARTLVDVYLAHKRRLTRPGARNSVTMPYAALDATFADPALQDVLSQPGLGDCTQTEARRTETQSYVIGVYNDTARSLIAREAAAHATSG
jgi:hypothetical protein